MKPVDCEFESEVLAAAVQSRWPEHADPGLRAHVSTCAICSDAAAVAAAIDRAREETRASAVIPDSGRVWWLARLRARREAAEAACRPITAAQAIAVACAAGLLSACFGATSIWFQSALRWIAGLRLKAFVPSATALVVEHGALAAAMAAVLFLAPAAVYLAIGRD